MSALTPRQKLHQGEPLTLQDLARLAGCSVAQVRKYHRCVPARLAVYRVGRMVRIRSDEATRFLAYLGALDASVTTHTQ